MIDSQSLTLSLPEDKIVKLHKELEFFVDRTRATKKQIQRLCGIIAQRLQQTLVCKVMD